MNTRIFVFTILLIFNIIASKKISKKVNCDIPSSSSKTSGSLKSVGYTKGNQYDGYGYPYGNQYGNHNGYPSGNQYGNQYGYHNGNQYGNHNGYPYGNQYGNPKDNNINAYIKKL